MSRSIDLARASRALRELKRHLDEHPEVRDRTARMFAGQLPVGDSMTEGRMRMMHLRVPTELRDRIEAQMERLQTEQPMFGWRLAAVARIALEAGVKTLERDDESHRDTTARTEAPAPVALAAARPADPPGDRLRAWRTTRGLSQKAAGVELGTDQGTISSLENGRRPPPAGLAQAIERAVGIPAGAWR